MDMIGSEMKIFDHMTGDGTLRGHVGAISVVFSTCFAWIGLLFFVVPLVIFYAVIDGFREYIGDLYRSQLGGSGLP